MAGVSSKDYPLFHKILVIDIETVPVSNDWDSISESLRHQWLRKMQFLNLTDVEMADPGKCFRERAGVYAEFAKIVCVGMGLFSGAHKTFSLRLKAVKGHDERQLLGEFARLLAAFENVQKEVVFCGHNIKEFDIPFICRRYLINGLPLPPALQLGGLKPWQVPVEDTLQLWRFGDHKNYTPLDLLATVLSVPSSKTDMDGSQVASVYWEAEDLDRIARYCLQDVYTTASVYLRLKAEPGAELPAAVFVDDEDQLDR